jgi:hypothetical protein
MKADSELEPLARLIEALDPWLSQVVIIGGWAHRLYRLDPRAQKLAYPPLTTLDSDVDPRHLPEPRLNEARSGHMIA